MTARHLLVAISGHGFGHLAQVAPVVNALRRRLPDLAVTVRTVISREVVASRLRGEFRWWGVTDDFGLIQTSAFDVDVKRSREAYWNLHADWPARVDALATEFRNIAPDLVLADVSYLAAAASAKAGIPSVAMCSLNWADIYLKYIGRDQIYRQMLEAYQQADWFLRPEPSMPMPELPSSRRIGLIAESGNNRRQEIDAAVGLRPSDKLVLVSLGGIPSRLPVERWPHLPGVRWLVPGGWGIDRHDMVEVESVGISYSDILASSDVLLTKPGYGNFAEAACCGVPVVYIPRGDWPEEPYLVNWLASVGQAFPMEWPDVDNGRVAAIAKALSAGHYGPRTAEGNAQGAEFIVRLLGLGS